MFHPLHTTEHTRTRQVTDSPGSDADPLQHRFGGAHRLPRGLRDEAAGMDWQLFTTTYAPLAEIRLGNIRTEKLRGGMFRYAIDRLHTSKTRHAHTEAREIVATGPVSACTGLLAEVGRHVEILGFHQREIFAATATFLRVTDGRRSCWAVGFGPTGEASVAAALSSAGQRVHG